MKSIFYKFPFYIILFPSFTVLILAANNLGQIQLNVILLPLLFSNLASIFIFLLGLIIFKQLNRAGLLSFATMLLVLTYGYAFNFMEGRYIGKWVIGTHFYMLILWAILYIGLLILLLFILKEPKPLTLILNSVVFFLVIFQLIRITSYEVRVNIINKKTSQQAKSTLLNPAKGQVLPDVYFIILDKYGRSDTIKNTYGYDNSEFISALENLGFYVPQCARSNYAFTVMSLSSELNMDFVENLTDDPSLKTTTALIQNNVVDKAFEDIGYTTIAFDMGFSWGNMKDFDYYFSGYPENIDTWSIDPFELLYIKTTLGLLLFEDKVDLGRQVSLSDLEQKAARTQLVLDVLPEIPNLPGPKFVYAHIVSPHPPYLFNPDGSINPDAEEIDPIEGYRSQLEFLEPRIIDVVTQILEKSKTPPIIIIQGDHGFGKKYVTSILLALYLPDVNAMGLDENMTLINVFPHIFNTYFNTDINYLPDLSFTHTSDWYESVPIEEWNPACRSD